MKKSINVSVNLGLPNRGISSKRHYSTFKQGHLSNVRVIIDDGNSINFISNCNELIPLFGVDLSLNLLNTFISSHDNYYSCYLSNGHHIVIFSV